MALKVLRPELAASAEALRRFSREGRAMARLAPHPNLIGDLTAGEDRGVAFLVMELVEGRTSPSWSIARGRCPRAWPST